MWESNYDAVDSLYSVIRYFKVNQVILDKKRFLIRYAKSYQSTIFVVITLIGFNGVIKLQHFGVIRLRSSNNYDDKVHDSNNNFVIYKIDYML